MKTPATKSEAREMIRTAMNAEGMGTPNIFVASDMSHAEFKMSDDMLFAAQDILCAAGFNAVIAKTDFSEIRVIRINF